MTEATGRGRAAITTGEVEFDARDAALFRAIHRTGSVAAAATELGRSRARALSRVETLEGAFGTLVERQRGGSDGGGSRLTEAGRRLLERYDRLAAVLSVTATVPETVLTGTVVAVDGEMADVETAVGTLRGLHDGLAAGGTVDVRVGADDVTVHEPGTAPAPGSTSARNRLDGTVSGVEPGEAVLTVRIDVDGTPFRGLVTRESADRLALGDGDAAVILWKATATRLVAGVDRSTDGEDELDA